MAIQTLILAVHWAYADPPAPGKPAKKGLLGRGKHANGGFVAVRLSTGNGRNKSREKGLRLSEKA